MPADGFPDGSDRDVTASAASRTAISSAGSGGVSSGRRVLVDIGRLRGGRDIVPDIPRVGLQFGHDRPELLREFALCRVGISVAVGKSVGVVLVVFGMGSEVKRADQQLRIPLEGCRARLPSEIGELPHDDLQVDLVDDLLAIATGEKRAAAIGCAVANGLSHRVVHPVYGLVETLLNVLGEIGGVGIGVGVGVGLRGVPSPVLGASSVA